MKSTYLYSIFFLKVIIAVLVILFVSCDSESKKEDDLAPESKFMQWEANVELNTKVYLTDKRMHTIYFPPSDCSYEIMCTNFSKLQFFGVDMIGEHLWPSDPGYVPVDYWCSWDRKNLGSIYDGKSVVTPYYSFEIRGNTLYANLKGGTVDPVPCMLTFGIKADDDHCETFRFIPESERN